MESRYDRDRGNDVGLRHHPHKESSRGTNHKSSHRVLSVQEAILTLIIWPLGVTTIECGLCPLHPAIVPSFIDRARQEVTSIVIYSCVNVVDKIHLQQTMTCSKHPVVICLFFIFLLVSVQAFKYNTPQTSSIPSLVSKPKMSFYKRPLPESCVALSSNRGKQIFASALTNAGLKSFFPLIEQL